MALTAFVAMAVVVELTPGPNMAWLALTSATQGRRAGWAAVAGIAMGLSVLAIVAAVGLADLALRAPAAFAALRFAGIAYMLWLAWLMWRGEEGAPARTGDRQAAYFRHGLALNLLNPKAAAFFVTLLPTFASTAQPSLAQLGLLSAIYVAIATAVHAAIVVGAAAAHHWLADAARLQKFGRIAAVLTFGVAIWMAVATIPS